MISDILKRKRLVNKAGEIIIDLCEPSIRYDMPTITIVDAFYVGEDMAMRPDLIAMKAYGNVDDYDILLKYNGYSNPFAVDYRDLILVPDLHELRDKMVTRSDPDNNLDIRSQYIDPSKKSVIDPKKTEYDNMIKKLKDTGKGINFSKFNLPPNISEPGETEGLIQNGQIILGAFIGKQNI